MLHSHGLLEQIKKRYSTPYYLDGYVKNKDRQAPKLSSFSASISSKAEVNAKT